MLRKQRSRLTETVQTGLPTWTERADDALALPQNQQDCDRFFYDAFADCTLPVMIYGTQGQRLVHPPNTGEVWRFPVQLNGVSARRYGPDFTMSEAGLVYIFDQLDRWSRVPADVAFVAILVDLDWFRTCTHLDLTPSEFELVCLLLSGHDLASAADHVGARYDTKRKQVRTILEKAGVSGQAALLRDLALALSSHILSCLLRADHRRPEVDLAHRVYGRDVVIHSISLGEQQDIPVWEFGARRGQTVLYFHSMLAPIMFTPDMVAKLKRHDLRVLMIPRHFFETQEGKERAQQQILRAASEIVAYFSDDPVICLGESAGCAWAAQFTLRYPERVSEVVFAATPQAVRPQDAARVPSRTLSLLTEVSTRIRQDERVIAGLTRIYNAIARVPSLSRRSIDFMLRQSAADLASIDTAFSSLALGDWVGLIANKAARASIDEVAHLQSDWVNDLHHLTRPMRFFHGTEDTLCPIEDAKAMVAPIPNARFTAYDKAGHLVLGQRLDDILATLLVSQDVPKHAV